MKKIVTLLMLIPFATSADQLESEKSLMKFEKLCASSKDPMVRSTNCKLVKMQRKAMIISKAQATK